MFINVDLKVGNKKYYDRPFIEGFIDFTMQLYKEK